MTGKEKAAVLRCAADAIEGRGWCQGHYQDRYGRLCTIGAVSYCETTHPEPSSSYEQDEHSALGALRRYMRDQEGMGMIAWNDADARTKEDVVSTLRAAAAWVEVQP